MNLKNISWHDNSRRFQKDSHALFGASKYAWVNYTEDKMIKTYVNSQAKKHGTELHEMAALLIKNKTKLPNKRKTINMYVNDSILLDLRPEEQLYYSDLFYGTADSIGISKNILHIHDLKTGETKASIQQLRIYAAFFLLEYGLIPSDFDGIELRIYQNDDILIEKPEIDTIVPIMDKIVTVNDIIQKMREDDKLWTT